VAQAFLGPMDDHNLDGIHLVIVGDETDPGAIRTDTGRIRGIGVKLGSGGVNQKNGGWIWMIAQGAKCQHRGA